MLVVRGLTPFLCTIKQIVKERRNPAPADLRGLVSRRAGMPVPLNWLRQIGGRARFHPEPWPVLFSSIPQRANDQPILLRSCDAREPPAADACGDIQLNEPTPIDNPSLQVVSKRLVDWWVELGP